MKLKTNGALLVYIRLFLSIILFYAAMEIVSRLFNMIFNTRISNVFSDLGLWGVALTSIIISLFTLPNYLHTAKAIRMDDKVLFNQMITSALHEMKWKIEVQEETKLVFKSMVLFPYWTERITIRYTDTELQISGAREYIEKAIRMAKFPYGSFEISDFES